MLPRSLPDWAAARPVVVHAWAAALVLAAAWVAPGIPVEWTPQVELRRVSVEIEAAGFSPTAVERIATAPIERALSALEGAGSVESVSEDGGGTVSVEVGSGADPGPFTARVSEAVSRLNRTFPEGVRARTARERADLGGETGPVLVFQVAGGVGLDSLRAYASGRLAPALRTVPGVSTVTVRGGGGREVVVRPDVGALRARGLTVDAVERSLAAASGGASLGPVTAGDLLGVVPAAGSVEDLREIVVPTPVGDGAPVGTVAEVTVGPAASRSVVRVDGVPAVVVEIGRASGTDLLDLAGRVLARADEARDSLPEGVALLVADDQSETVRRELGVVRRQGAAGLLLVVSVLVIMLAAPRAVAVTLWTVVVTLAGALVGLRLMGLSFNLVSIAGVVLVVGLLVDNATVVVESITAGERAGAAVRAVAAPLTVGTATTVAALAPAVFLSGPLRALFLPLGLLVSLTLVLSLLASFTVPPASARFVHGAPPPPPERWTQWVARVYGVGAAFPRTVLAAFVLLVGVPLWAVAPEPADDGRRWMDVALGGIVRPFVEETEFRGAIEPGVAPRVTVALEAPAGTPSVVTEEVARRYERVALANPSVARTVLTTEGAQATLRVLFHPVELRGERPYVLRERLVQEALSMGGYGVVITGLLPNPFSAGMGGEAGSPLTVTTYGPEYVPLGDVARRFAERVAERDPRVIRVNPDGGPFGARPAREVLRVEWSPERVRASGVTAAELARVLRPSVLADRAAFEIDLGDETLPVRVVTDALDADVLAREPLAVSDSVRVAIREGSYTTAAPAPRVERSGQRYRRYVNVYFRGGFRAGEEYLRREIEAFETPLGYSIEYGQPDLLREQRVAMSLVLAGAGLAVYLVMAAAFGSWTAPAVVMTSLPAAGVGVAAAFLLEGIAFTEGAAVGALLLVGISVNDAALLVHRYRELSGGSRGDRLVVAVRQRLRPMWTTTLTSIAAVAPALAGPGSDPFWAGLALTTIGGLMASTALGPLVIIAVLSVRPPSPSTPTSSVRSATSY